MRVPSSAYTTVFRILPLPAHNVPVCDIQRNITRTAIPCLSLILTKYSGNSCLHSSQLLTRPCHSIINQAFDSRLRLDTRRPMNGDGFGVGEYSKNSRSLLLNFVHPLLGWYDSIYDPELGSQPCIFTSVTPVSSCPAGGIVMKLTPRIVRRGTM